MPRKAKMPKTPKLQTSAIVPAPVAAVDAPPVVEPTVVEEERMAQFEQAAQEIREFRPGTIVDVGDVLERLEARSIGIRISGYELKARLRQERRESRLSEKGY